MQLQTITDDYRRLNRELHESSTPYGVFGFRYAEKVSVLRDEHECETALDYGCGKSTLRASLGSPDWMSEYDPAIPGKDARPAPADLVVCTDVLEHIEPELLDNVLTDLVRCTRKVALLAIATRQSIKLLPDGTSPHKIVHGAEWWRERLAAKFYIIDFEAVDDGELVAVVSPVRPIKEIRAKSAVSDTVRFENALLNCSRVPGRVLGSDMEPRHDGRVCIVCFGPSLKDTWHTLRTERRAFGSKIATVSGAHDFLIERGIIPDYHVEVDPREHKCFFTRTPHPGVTYWPASCVHPKLIDNLIEHNSNVALWHLLNSDNDFKIHQPGGPDPGSILVSGGSGVGSRACSLFFVLGYRTFSIYGMDSSFANDSGKQHAGEHSGKIKPEWKVRVGERWFRSSSQMVYMARAMVDQCRMFEQMCVEQKEPCIPGSNERTEWFFHGDGLLAHMIREGNRMGEMQARDAAA